MNNAISGFIQFFTEYNLIKDGSFIVRYIKSTKIPYPFAECYDKGSFVISE